MEVKKELPKVFDEFAEQRRKSFMTVKEIKDKGIPVVGAYCTYFPKELELKCSYFQSKHPKIQNEIGTEKEMGRKAKVNTER